MPRPDCSAPPSTPTTATDRHGKHGERQTIRGHPRVSVAIRHVRACESVAIRRVPIHGVIPSPAFCFQEGESRMLCVRLSLRSVFLLLLTLTVPAAAFAQQTGSIQGK